MSSKWLFQLAIQFFAPPENGSVRTHRLALSGLIVAVAALYTALSAMTGFESTLKSAVVETIGSIQIIHRSRNPDPWPEFEKRVKSFSPKVVDASPFVYVEAVMAKKGQVSSVLIQGLDLATSLKVLNLQNRLTAGSMLATDSSEQVLLGKELAAKMQVQVGDKVNLVVPLLNGSDNSFRRKTGAFTVAGIIDLGKYEWNQRFVVTDLISAQKLADIGDRYTGLVVSTDSPDSARTLSHVISEKLGVSFWVRDWRETNESLFSAVEIERVVLFLVLMIIMVVASFNVASTMIIGVLQRTPQMSVLRALGMTKRDIQKLFIFQGLWMGVLGLAGGMILGEALNFGFVWAQKNLNILPGSVYKIDFIQPSIRALDVFSIVAATLLICFLATYFSSKRSKNISIIEGLRYE